MIRACPSCSRRNRVPWKRLADPGRCGACKAPLPAIAEPVDVDTAQFDDIVAHAKVPVLVDFWAEWCGPCKMAAPVVQQLARERAGSAMVLKVNTEANPQLAARYGVRGIPNFVVFKNGKVEYQRAGLADQRELSSWLD